MTSVTSRRIGAALLMLIGLSLSLAARENPLTKQDNAGQRRAEHPSWTNSDGTRPAVVPGVLVVKFKAPSVMAKVGATEALSVAARIGAVSVEPVFPKLSDRLRAASDAKLASIYLVTLPSGTGEFEAAALLNMEPEIEYAEPKFMRYLDYTPADPLYAGGAPGPQTTYLNRIKASQGWDIVRADSTAGGIIPKSGRVIIATVDGGTMWSHQDLVGNLWINTLEDVNGNGVFDNSPAPGGDIDGLDQDGNGYEDDVIGWNFTNDNPDPRGNSNTPQSSDHGTATASYFGASTNNGLGMAGVAFNCRLMPVATASATSDNGIAYGYEGIVYAAENGAAVINCSWGGTGYSQFEQDVITSVTAMGSLVVGAAGNDGVWNDLNQHYPSGYIGVLAVGSITKTTDAKSSFSNYGTTVPVYAPGENVVSCVDQDGGTTYQSSGWSGTSMSAPHAAGLAGLVKTYHPSWTPDQIRAQIRVTSDSIDGSNGSITGKVGHGRINFLRALTESHPGLELVNFSATTPRGENVVFLAGDTINISAALRNVLSATASNVTVTVTTSDASVTVLQNPNVVSSIAGGEQVTLSPMALKVSASLTTAKKVFIKLSFSSNGGADKDATGFMVSVYPSLPNWSLQNGATSSIISLKAVNDQVLWAGGNAGAVTRTTDGGQHWFDVSSATISGDIYNISAADANLAFVTTTPSTTTFIYRTTDGGASWAQVYSQSGGFIDAIHMFDVTNGLAMGDPVGGKWTILRTTDGGASWYRIATEPNQVGGEAGWNNAMAWTDANHGWFGTNSNKVYRTTDGGATWLSASTTGANSVSVSFADNLNGMVGYSLTSASTSLMARTTNGGSSWIAVTGASSSTSAYVGAAPGSSYVWYRDAANNMRRSVQGGTSGTWQTQYLPPITGIVSALAFLDSSTGWASTESGEIMKLGTYAAAPVITTPAKITATNGSLYYYDVGAAGIPSPKYYLTEYPVGMTMDSVTGVIGWTPDATGDFFVSLYAVNSLGTDEQSFTIHVDPPSNIGDPTEGLPKTYALRPNYPNPFNPGTSIRYDLPRESRVSIRIYNLIGQEVRTLVDGIQQPGRREIYWDASDNSGHRVSSGVYFYRIIADQFTQTRKMVLMK